MPSRPYGNSKGRGLAHGAVDKEDLQLAEYQIPILTSGVPVLHNPLGRQIEHFAQRIVIGKAGLVLGDLPELPVQALNDVCRVYDFPDLRWGFKESAQNFQVILPALDAGRVLSAPGIREPAPVLFRLIQGNGGVDLFRVGNDLFDAFIADIPGGAVNLVDDTPLQLALGIDCPAKPLCF